MKELERLLEFNSEEEKQELIDELKLLNMVNKTPEEIIQSIRVNKANLDHIASTNKINGSLFVDFKRCLEEYGKQQYNQGVLDCIENAKWKHNGLYNRNAEGTFLSESGISIDTHSMKKLIKQ